MYRYLSPYTYSQLNFLFYVVHADCVSKVNYKLQRQYGQIANDIIQQVYHIIGVPNIAKRKLQCLTCVSNEFVKNLLLRVLLISLFSMSNERVHWWEIVKTNFLNERQLWLYLFWS